ncbi:MAG: glycine cleavage system aminomethyltransferase GcvT [Dehalococcoidia bacterium]
MTTAALRQLPLADAHRALGARFAPFAGWEMPVQYAGIVEEHNAVRQRAGVFDVSHMGRLYVTGRDAGRLLRRAHTYKIDEIAEGEAHYALLCDENGGILDDVFIYRLEAERFLVVNNAANAEVGRERITLFREDGMDAQIDDRQAETVMLAVQGPDAPEIVSRVVGTDLRDGLPRRRCMEIDFEGEPLFASRTGYTGEDGFELVAPVRTARVLLQGLVAAGVAPAGLGARDTLRLEAALPLYGNDIDATTNPFEAGLGFAVIFDDDADFSGRDALAQAKEGGLSRKLSCLRAEGRGIMRSHYVILHGGDEVATVASGGFSPTLNVSIGMAYLPVDLAREGTELQVDARGKPLPVHVVKRPFYRAAK